MEDSLVLGNISKIVHGDSMDRHQVYERRKATE